MTNAHKTLQWTKAIAIVLTCKTVKAVSTNISDVEIATVMWWSVAVINEQQYLCSIRQRYSGHSLSV
jgi:hypothetical protein